MDLKSTKIIACKALPDYQVWIEFSDGAKGVVDLQHLVGEGVFKSWESVDFFNQVYIDPYTHTLAWGEEIDLDPYVLRERLVEQDR